MKVASYVFLFLVGFCAGTYFGFRQAPTEFLAWESQFRASLLAFENISLKQGNIDSQIELNEIKLDAELANYGRHLDSKLFWLLALTDNLESDEQSIRHAVEYRIANPYTAPKLSIPSDDNPEVDKVGHLIFQSIVATQTENEILRQRVITMYTPQ